MAQPPRVAYSPREASLASQSFNAIVERRHFDPTEAMMQTACLSRAAQRGPGWMPNGLAARTVCTRLESWGKKLMSLDNHYKMARVNPGTTADLLVVSIMIYDYFIGLPK